MALTLKSDIVGNGVDQGTLVDLLTNIKDVLNELQTDHATYKTVVDDAKALLNQLRTKHLYGVFGNPGFVIDTNFDVKNGTAVYYTNGGTLKTLAANVNFDTGTTKTIASSQWAAAMLTVNASGTGVVTWGATAASEALAIAALAAPAATDTVLGYVTVNAHASGFTAGTDALTTGTGGNVATATNYYNSINPNTLMIAAAVASSAPATLTNSTAITLLRG